MDIRNVNFYLYYMYIYHGAQELHAYQMELTLAFRVVLPKHLALRS